MKKFFLLIIFITFGKFLQAQDVDTIAISGSEKVIIDSIKISGNEITEDFIILRELTFQSGDTLDLNILNFNRERVYSLGIFTRVSFVITKESPGHILNIIVEESWYIYPIPFAQLVDKDWKKISYGIDLVIINFRGRNEYIRARSSFGYDRNYFIQYRNPNFIRSEDIYLIGFFSYMNARNKSNIAEFLAGSDFDQVKIYTRLDVGKRFGLYNKAGISLSYNYVETPFYIKGISASNERIDRFPALGISYEYDTRDLVQFPRNGIFGFTNIEFKGLGFNSVNYRVIDFDFRFYKTLIGELSAKWRFSSRFTSGNTVPYYDYSFLGFSSRIRGHFTLEQEGNNSYLTSLEMYYPIIKELNISFDFIPLLPKELLTYRTALYVQMFTDAGAVQNDGSPISLRDFNSGYGLGLTFLVLPYNIFRIEYAFNHLGKSEWIFDLGISF
jgi:outer membrane protein assembly factor BamA